MSEHQKLKVQVTNYIDQDMTTYDKPCVDKGVDPEKVCETIPGDNAVHTMFEIKSHSTVENQGRLFYNLPDGSVLTIFYHMAPSLAIYILPQYSAADGSPSSKYFLKVRGTYTNQGANVGNPLNLESHIEIHKSSAENLFQGNSTEPQILYDFTSIVTLKNNLVAGSNNNFSDFITLNSFPHPSQGYTSIAVSTWGNIAAGAVLVEGGIGVAPGETNTLMYAANYGTGDGNRPPQSFEWIYNVGDGVKNSDTTLRFSFEGGQDVFKQHPPKLNVFFSGDSVEITGNECPSYDPDLRRWTFSLIANYTSE